MERYRVAYLAVGILFGVSCLATSSADGQQRRGAGLGRGGMTLIGLLERESVRKELALSDAQVESIQKLAREQRENRGGLRKLSPDERLAGIQRRIAAEQAALAETLADGQMQRLRQISYQVRGAVALSDSTVVEILSLTEEQQKQLRSVLSEADKARQDFDPHQAEASRQRIEAARQSATDKALGILTPTQSAKWQEMLGTPFRDE